MGKRSSFDRVERDFYPTPEVAVRPLLPHIPRGVRFAEPCAGNGALVKHLVNLHRASCIEMYDIEPQHHSVEKMDFRFAPPLHREVDYVITNPPWSRDILHPLIQHFRWQRPTWLLFDADWMHTKQSRDYLQFCRKIVSVGRVKWIPDSKHTGKDNCAWYLFDTLRGGETKIETVFYGRADDSI